MPVMIIADTHVHLYPFADRHRFFPNAIQRMQDHAASGDTLVLMFTERFDCHAFNELARGEGPLPPGWTIRGLEDDCRLRLANAEGTELVLAAGHQMVSAERVEILGLMMRTKIADGLPAEQTIQRIRDAGGVPVLSWAPGKWLGTRGLILDRLLEQFGPEQIALGDTSLRPLGWREPFKMKAARGHGFRVLCGSDPLPIAGEESVVGTYASRIHASVDTLRESLLDPGIQVDAIGRRGGPFSVARRLVQNHRARKRRS